jgi:hypothetical protein
MTISLYFNNLRHGRASSGHWSPSAFYRNLLDGYSGETVSKAQSKGDSKERSRGFRPVDLQRSRDYPDRD